MLLASLFLYSIQKKKLEENLIFFLAGLGKENYVKLTQIFQLFEDGKLCKLPKSKQGLMSGRAECASCNFKGLRGLPEDVVTDLLDKVIKKEIGLKKLNMECKKLKDMKNMKLEFVKQTGLKTWNEAQQKFPYYATEDRFAQFAGKAFDSKNSPSSDFLVYCRKAISSRDTCISDHSNAVLNTVVVKTDGDVTVKCALFDLSDPTELTYSNVCSSIPGFPGFNLIFASTGTTFSVSSRLEKSWQNNANLPTYSNQCFCIHLLLCMVVIIITCCIGG